MGRAPKEWNFVGKEDDGSDVILQLEWIRQSPQFKKIGSVPFMLQEVVDGIEFATGAFWMYDDWLRDANGDIFIEVNKEHKKMLDGNLGISCGEMGTVLAFKSDATKLFEETLEKLTPVLEKECPDICIDVDANCGVVEEDGKSKAYPFELTIRPGYPACAIQEYLLDSPVGEFYANMIDGRQGEFDYKKTWGVVTNIGTGDYPHESVEDNHPDTFKNQPVKMTLDEHVNPAYVKWDEEKEVYRIADDYAWAATVCFDGKSIEEANKKCVEAMEKIEVRSPVFRTDIGEKFAKKELSKLEALGYL